MRFHHTRLALSLIAALSACTAVQDESSDAKPAQEPARPTPAEVADPMASSARLVGGEWRLTFPSGTSMYTTSHWGPGKHSLRSMTHGSDAAGNPWRDLGVAYWHPGRKQVCMLGLSPWARGVSEGVIEDEGESWETAFDHFQTGEHRKLVARSVFDGPDKFRSALFEMTGPDVLTPMAEWDLVRYRTLTPMRPPTAREAGKPSEHLKALESFLGHTWETTGKAKGDWATGAAFQSTFEWVPLADGIYARVLASSEGGEPAHLLDAYLYHHTGTGAPRCLALSNRGGVYEGDVAVLEGGNLQLDLKGYEGDQVVPHVVRFDFEKDGTLRNRVWSLEGTDRELMLDVHHKKVEPKKD